MSKKIINRYVEFIIKGYIICFGALVLEGSFEKVNLRVSWIIKKINFLQNDMKDMFPTEWNIVQLVAKELCSNTSLHFKQILLTKTYTISDIVLIIKVINKTSELEIYLNKELSLKKNNDEKIFTGIITKDLGQLYQVYINFCENVLADFFPKISKDNVYNETLSNFPSSSNLFLFFKRNLQKCENLPAEYSIKLSKIYGQYLTKYGDLLRSELTKNINNLNYGCYVLNTVDYCYSMTEQLESKMSNKSGINDINFNEQKDLYLLLIEKSINYIVDIIVKKCEDPFDVMIKMSWSKIDSMNDQSKYVVDIEQILNYSVTMVRNIITDDKYFNNLCYRLSEKFLYSYSTTLFQLKRICGLGAEQLLLEHRSLNLY